MSNVTIELTEAQEKYLKKFYEDHHVGSKKNLATATPIHVVEQIRYTYVPYNPMIDDYSIKGHVAFICEDHVYHSIESVIEDWNENINTFIQRVGDKYDEKLITVVSDNGLKSIELTPISLQCFYTVFNGSVCDEVHWQYFQECLEYARRITGMQA